MLKFYPLYWIYHDCCKYTDTTPSQPQNLVTTYYHAGHTHFFMPDYNPYKQATQQAYTGSQTYEFSIEDKWGPNSTDPNQRHSYRLIGKPRWYFLIEEYWRRIYIQPWDVEDYSSDNRNVTDGEHIGIKYDCSLPQHTLGPFRENRGSYFFNSELNRTLPVEYWLDIDRNAREHFLRKKHTTEKYPWDETKGNGIWVFRGNVTDWKKITYPNWLGDNWNGNSTEDIHDPKSYNSKGDYVRVTNGKEIAYFRYDFIASSHDTPQGGRYWPNPSPVASEADLRREYLNYFSFCSPSSYNYGKFARQYEEWLIANGMEDDSNNFNVFLNTVNSDLLKTCYEKEYKSSVDSNGYPVSEIVYNQNKFVYEYISFSEFCHIWTRIDDDEAERVELNGSYPLKRTIPLDSESEDRYEQYKNFYTHREVYTIPRESVCKGDRTSEDDLNSEIYSDEDGARRFYPDHLYITPIIEYQKVTHLDYERLPEQLAMEQGIDIWTDQGGFGDGFSVKVEIPFRINGTIQSPFSDDNKIVSPPGIYHHDCVKENDKLRYAAESFGNKMSIDELNYIISQSKHTSPEQLYAEAFPNVSKYAREDFLIQLNRNLSAQEWLAWYNDNYADKPILWNYDEGKLDAYGNWIPVVTNDRPLPEQVEKDESTGELTCNGKVASFRNPGYPEDGIWVEQCLGATVKPRVELVFEDALGHRWIETVDNLQAKSGQAFVGKD